MRIFKAAAIAVAFLLLLSSCASGPKVVRSKETDAQLRVFVDPDILPEHHVQIVRALVQTGHYDVVSRNEAFTAVLREQERQHGFSARRYNPKERWAWVQEFYGASAVISARPTCVQKQSWTGRWKHFCKQEISLINASTGQVIVAVAGENEEDYVAAYSVPDWDAVVQKMTDEYPKYFEPRIVKAPLDQYMLQSEERAKREQEFRTRVPTNSTSAVITNSLNIIKDAHDKFTEEQKENDNGEN